MIKLNDNYTKNYCEIIKNKINVVLDNKLNSENIELSEDMVNHLSNCNICLNEFQKIENYINLYVYKTTINFKHKSLLNSYLKLNSKFNFLFNFKFIFKLTMILLTLFLLFIFYNKNFSLDLSIVNLNKNSENFLDDEKNILNVAYDQLLKEEFNSFYKLINDNSILSLNDDEIDTNKNLFDEDYEILVSNYSLELNNLYLESISMLDNK